MNPDRVASLASLHHRAACQISLGRRHVLLIRRILSLSTTYNLVPITICSLTAIRPVVAMDSSGFVWVFRDLAVTNEYDFIA